MRTETTPSTDLEYLVIGAGAAGLQAAYFLARAGRRYLVVEASDEVGGFWRRLPRSRRLISFNKVNSVFGDPEANLRWDWNSLLTDDHSSPFQDFSRRLFPTGDEMADYLRHYAEQHDLRIALRSRVDRVEREPGGRFAVALEGGAVHRASTLIVAAGLAKPYLPPISGIEHAEGYEDVTLDPDAFAGQRVLVIGKGNSGFETADAAIRAASLVHIASPSSVRFSWRTRHSGDVRSHYSAIADMYQLKTLNTILDCRIDEIRALDDGSKAVTITFSHARDQRQQAVYDRVIRCTGYRFDPGLFAPSCRPQMTIDDRFPALTEAWESVNVPDLFFAGTTMQSLDFRQSASAFVAGFRYNVRTLHRLLEQRYDGVPLPASRLPLDVAAVTDAVLERTSRTSGLWTQFGFLCDALVVDEQAGEVLIYPELPIDYVKAGRLGDHRLVFAVTIEWGPLAGDPFRVERQPVPEHAHEEVFLHPVARRIADGEVVAEHHVLEDLFGVFHASEESGMVRMRSELEMEPYHEQHHVEPLREFLESTINPRRRRPVGAATT